MKSFSLAKPVAGIIGVLALAGTISFAAAQQPRGERPQPRLTDLMQGAQVGHIKLWFAGKAGNWGLATYETRQLKARLEDAAQLYQSLPVNDITTMAKPLDAISAAIAAKDTRQFARAYDELTAGCNSCHQSAKLGFVSIRRPTANPFSDQEFEAGKK
ncbi:hypothetical protein [Rhodopseudomonas sp. BR0M22]|uniref:hypothetical protein n=1 Tax=Rhodopseudomonas sp. BR0M22 TaxID=2269369 RepID=UPI0013E02906|nr:hypothetical protein [Rhodopseudomonas sp. BR0M22]MCD0417080.1 hypothetical protein [Rubrivivax sp. JA1024]NEW94034.1 hypothetical protein [Rhodopseudomonas sp. BR0M22]